MPEHGEHEVTMEDVLFFSESLIFVRPIERYGQILCEVYATWPESQQSWLVAECFVINSPGSSPHRRANGYSNDYFSRERDSEDSHYE